MDLFKHIVVTLSPDDGIPETREVTNACVVVPVEVSGVIGVTSIGYEYRKAYYSNYGVGVTAVTAPGGDARFQLAPSGFGGVLSTVPGGYAFLQGTSMASPHVAGVAALAISARGRISPGALSALIRNTADPMGCPANPFNPGPPFNWSAVCQGGAGANGFFGHGLVNALSAVASR
jgi:hypothetical protein